MKRTTIFLPEHVEGDLRAIARREGVAVAEVVREALSQYVVRAKKRDTSRPRFVAMGASGASGTADRHEDLLWQGLEPHDDTAAVPAQRARRQSNARRRAR